MQKNPKPINAVMEATNVSLVALLHNAEQAATAAFGRIKGDLNITLIQFSILNSLISEQGSQIEVVRRTGIDRSTLSETARRLEAKGFASRDPSTEDARRCVLKITDDGIAAAIAASTAAQRALDELLKPIAAAKRSSFLDQLQEIVLANERELALQPRRKR